MWSIRALALAILVLLTTGCHSDFESGPWNCFTHNDRGFDRIKPSQSHCHMQLRKDGQDLVDWEFSSDPYGRRVVPKSAGARGKRFVSFLGCSFTFGQLVSDEESMPSQFLDDVDSNDLAIYNYGEVGYGPNGVLESLQSRDLKREIPQNDGIFVYTWIPDHARRVIGSLSHGWTDGQPDYQLDSDGRPVLMGSHRSAHPILYRVYDILRKLHLGDALGFDIPPRITNSDFELIVSLIREIQKTTAKNFPKSRFYLVLWPVGGPPDLELERRAERVFRAAFSSGPIHLLDYTDLDPHLPHRNFPDGHPTPALYRIVAARIARDLEAEGVVQPRK